jgi:LysM repeat protein
MENRPSLSDTRPRTCPNCGTSVSSRAKTCLICGAGLTLPVAPAAREPEVGPAARAFSWRIVAITAGVIALLLAGGVLLLRPRVATPLATPTLTFTPTSMPTDTPTPQPPTATPTATSTSRPTETPIPPTRYTVRTGDTLSSIATKFDTTLEVLQTFNGLGQSDVIQVGQVIQIPAPGATPGPTTTARPTETFMPGPTPGTVLHVVQSGDTLLGISLRYGVPMNIIQKANDIQDPESIRAGQQLVIPIGPTGTATAGPQPTPTGPPIYAAPLLLSPPDDPMFEQVEGGTPPTPFRTRATGWHVPVDLFPKPADSRRVFQWQVHVVRVTGAHADGTPIYSDAGPASAIRSFRWLIAQPTPTPTPGPT